MQMLSAWLVERTKLHKFLYSLAVVTEEQGSGTLPTSPGVEPPLSQTARGQAIKPRNVCLALTQTLPQSTHADLQVTWLGSKSIAMALGLHRDSLDHQSAHMAVEM
jgi:hypothetical protein